MDHVKCMCLETQVHTQGNKRSGAQKRRMSLYAQAAAQQCLVLFGVSLYLKIADTKI